MAGKNARYGPEEASFGSRETTLGATFPFAPARVFNALEQAAERQGLKTLMSSAANGLLVARPPLSLLNLGRRVTVTVSPAGEEGPTRVRAGYTHGLVSFQDRYARLALLSDLLRRARLQLEAGDAAREAAQHRTAAPPQPGAASAPPPPPPRTEESPDGKPEASRPYPTLGELRAKARAEELARRGVPPGGPAAEEFLAAGGEGFRLPARFKARRIFWFALGVVLAVVLMALFGLSRR